MMVSCMLHFPGPLTPAATEVFQHCLEIASDLVRPDALGGDWAMAYPQSAKCLSAEQAREAMLDLLDKLPQPQVYVPTSYHWLLMYECLHFQFECINDDPLPSLIASLKGCVNEWDDSYLSLSPGSQGQAGLTINFEAFIAVYFWDTDFLLDPAVFDELEAPAKKSLGYRADLFGVLSGLSPHPTELVLKRLDQF